ncbi:MAG: hypothetical protein ABFD00_05710 [Chloroherpetonaceae bacterium]
MWIEIFKTGSHMDSNGQTQEFTAEDLDKIVQNYNSRIKEDDSFLAPVVKGHPESNSPSHGWVQQLGRRGQTLLAKLQGLSDELIDDIKDKRFQKVSISLYPNLLLRHIGMLGAASPAVKGLKPIEFTEDFIEFAVNEENSDSLEFPNEMNVLQNENNSLKAKIKEYQEQIATLNFNEYSEKIIQKGKLPLNLKSSLVELLAELQGIDSQSNKQNNLTQKFMDFIEKLTNNAPLGEFAKRESAIAYNFQEKLDEKKLNPERKEMHDEIIKLIGTNPNWTYEEAFNYLINN